MKKYQLFTFVLFLLSGFGCSPYQPYLQEIRGQVPLYDEQNDQLLDSLPLPLNTNQLNKLYRGIVNSSANARTLTVMYSSQNRFEDILVFYQADLIKNGWIQKHNFDDQGITSFHLNTACLEISDDTPKKTDQTLTPYISGSQYKITIWHDFFSQSFSLPTPNGVNLCSEIFAGACLPCPPK